MVPSLQAGGRMNTNKEVVRGNKLKIAGLASLILETRQFFP
jgi:hypothetical protein